MRRNRLGSNAFLRLKAVFLPWFPTKTQKLYPQLDKPKFTDNQTMPLMSALA